MISHCEACEQYLHYSLQLSALPGRRWLGCARTGIVGADQCVCPMLTRIELILTDTTDYFIVGTASCRLIVNATSCRYKLHGAQAPLTSSGGTFQV